MAETEAPKTEPAAAPTVPVRPHNTPTTEAEHAANLLHTMREAAPSQPTRHGRWQALAADFEAWREAFIREFHHGRPSTAGTDQRDDAAGQYHATEPAESEDPAHD